MLMARPAHLFRDPTATVLYDRDGRLLGARIAADGQWRFPESEAVPEKFAKALTCYEDRWFRFHPGFNPWALVRAAAMNHRAGRVVSGGSTLTMQMVRLSRKNKSRTYGEKLIETVLALFTELTRTKREILRLYASNAPFGGNVVGLDAAAWRYFGTQAGKLSWAEAATLAVLPNSPGLIYPGRNQATLLNKRNKLLDRMWQLGILDLNACELAKSEPLPPKPWPLPRLAPHLLNRLAGEGHRGERIVSTLDGHLQERVASILGLHAASLEANGIGNAAVLVVETATGRVLAYEGNLPSAGTGHGGDVDIITAPRSTGSILKPFLYAAMLNEGLILPNTLVPDIPVQIGGFIPENFSHSYDGAVPASRALARSLNIPAVKMLQTYGYTPFCTLLRNLGIATLRKPADHYGLSVILGGAEATLWDLTGIYASMARSLEQAGPAESTTASNLWHPPVVTGDKASALTGTGSAAGFSPAATWLTFEAMVEATRPDEDAEWQIFSSSRRIAWKTGTSFGNRDAWAVGVTPEYVVGVWAGNASGEGRPGLTGIGAAAPVLFDVFRSLPPTTWFYRPAKGLVKAEVCRVSGYRASELCGERDTIWIPEQGLRTAACPFHILVHLDSTGRFQVSSDCVSPSAMQNVAWFVLPPAQEWYFRTKNPFYRMLPPFRNGCASVTGNRNMELIYPREGSILYVPVDLDGKTGSTVFRAAHHNPDATVYWHLDQQFLGTTRQSHQMALSPERGFHRLTLTDSNGESLSIGFEIMTKEKQ